MFLPVFLCLSVCLSVCWMKCCVSTDVGTWTNWLTFEPDPDYSPDCFLRYRIALVRGILRRKNPTYIRIGTARRWSAWATRGFKMVLFTQPSKHLCRRYMRSTECPSSSYMHHPVSGINSQILFRQPRQSCLHSLPHSLVSSSLSSSPLSSSITPSLFHSRLKTYLVNKSCSP